MNYENRKMIVSSWLFNLLKRYEPPTHLDQDAAREEMVLMVEDINSELPNIDERYFKEHLERIARHVRKNQNSRRWPTIAMFMKGVREYSKSIEAKKSISEYDGDALSPMKINANRIKKGEDVCESFIQGARADEMIRLGYITRNDLDKYQKALE